MKSWSQISDELRLSNLIEGDVHPHVPQERAHMFHAHDPGATEFEFLNLIHALVLATKPTLCIETGTYTGLGTIAIASALAWNNHGNLITLDTDECKAGRELIAKYALGDRATFVTRSAIDFIRSYSEQPFQFAFIDSGSERLEETNLLHERVLLAPGSIVVLHDASPFRNPGETIGSRFERECSLKGHTISLSRGLRLMFHE
jgi:predicted O-methyltransferase YrrM